MEDSLQLIFSHSGSVLIAGEQILPHLGPSLLSLSSSPASRAHEAHTSRGCNVHKGLSTKQELNLREAKSAPVSFRIALTWVFPGGASGKEPSCHCRRCKRHGFDPWVRKIPWRREQHPTPIFLPGEFHGQRSLAGYSPWGRKESDTTE